MLVGFTEVTGPALRRSTDERSTALRLLVVDDDDPVRKACCEIAASMGFETLSAGSVGTALAVLTQHPVDMLLLDLKLPGGGGLSLLEQVRERYPDTAVVVMTAFATVSSAVEAMRIGAGGLSDEAVCAGGADGGAGADEPEAAVREREPQAAREVANRKGDGRPDRALAGDGEGLPDPVEGGAIDASGADPGGEWDGQGAGGAVDP